MDPRQACLACLAQEPPNLFEAALWIAAEHEPLLPPGQSLSALDELDRRLRVAQSGAPGESERAQWLLRQLSELGFAEDDDQPLRPRAALLPRVLQRRRGQPLSLALVALELARRQAIPLAGVSFPGRFLLRVPGADHLLDPATGRRLYPRDCRDLLARHLGPQVELSAALLRSAEPREMLQRLSRNLRQLHQAAGEPLAALKDAQRVLELGEANAADHLARADLYHILDCPQAERYDLERALLLSNDPTEQLRLGQRIEAIAVPKKALH
ncbi:SirB1 family protein [Pseudomonas citronellolis]|uniref:SirB1 family protein n=1 Tax=Pseudomonas citronellolis TaxID=53408 RepID=UPI0023E45736|nr:transglutaminase family protein [Pseudomonas citronellolis]MDF3936809.1 transglutaminase family protein [Pseudomonas citronellolis]